MEDDILSEQSHNSRVGNGFGSWSKSNSFSGGHKSQDGDDSDNSRECDSPFFRETSTPQFDNDNL